MKFFKAKKQKQLPAAEPMLPVVTPKQQVHHMIKIEETSIRMGRGPFKKTFHIKKIVEVTED